MIDWVLLFLVAYCAALVAFLIRVERRLTKELSVDPLPACIGQTQPIAIEATETFVFEDGGEQTFRVTGSTPAEVVATLRALQDEVLRVNVEPAGPYRVEL